MLLMQPARKPVASSATAAMIQIIGTSFPPACRSGHSPHFVHHAQISSDVSGQGWAAFGVSTLRMKAASPSK